MHPFVQLGLLSVLMDVVVFRGGHVSAAVRPVGLVSDAEAAVEFEMFVTVNVRFPEVI